MEQGILSLVANFPAAANIKQAEIKFQQWKELSGQQPLKDFIEHSLNDDSHRKILSAVFGNSPYLAQVLVKEPELFRSMLGENLDKIFSDVIATLNNEEIYGNSTDTVMSLLRKTKGKVSLLIALADIAGAWPLGKVTGKLSEFAEICIRLCCRHLLLNAAKRGEISIEDLKEPEPESGLIVLALGKLGASELNYSSDIDLIVFYDEQRLKYKGRATVANFYIQLTHELRRMLEDRTRDGYVFRVDLRLRPDPGSTPPAVSVRAAEVYYETLGQNWERAAMIKARLVAGDPVAGKNFMKYLEPYVWRKSLDFDSIQDIHSIKRQIDSRYGELPENLYGYNVKLGRGGIREIEFFVQTQQLIWGGRKPSLRTSATCETLKSLSELREISGQAKEQLTESYRFYRTVEHRLQMINDQQTHTLPDNAEKMKEFTTFLGYDKPEDFIMELTGVITTVRGHYARLFSEAPSLASIDVGGSLVFTGAENDPETLKTLTKMGFTDSDRISNTIRGWHHGRYRSIRTKRAREVLTELMPSLLKSFSESAHPDMAFFNFDEFISKLPAGVQIFSLLYNNPSVLSLMAEIMGGYPFVAENLIRSPALLEYVLAPEFYEALPEKEQLIKDLSEELSKEAENIEDVLNIARAWANDMQFRIAIQFIEKKIFTDDVSAKLSDISDVLLSLILNSIEEEFKELHGVIPNSNFGIVAFGKLGSREMTFGSDLDLVFVYDAPNLELQSNGDTPLPASQYYMRLSRRYINAVSALTGVGKLYEVDLRLRPSGNDGPIATSLSAFDQYYGTSAWAWEYMALTKARTIAGQKDFQNKILNTIKTKLLKKWNGRELSEGVIKMHEKVKENLATDNVFDIKYVPGGLMDIEYVSQFLQLKHASTNPEILETNTRISFNKLADAGIITEQTTQELCNAVTFYSDMLSIMRLMGHEKPKEKDITAGMKKLLIRNMKMTDFDALKVQLTHYQDYARKIFENTIITSI